jgi:hypothetical protein
MFQKVSDKFHRKQQSSSNKPSSPVSPQAAQGAYISKPQQSTTQDVPMDGIEQ